MDDLDIHIHILYSADEEDHSRLDRDAPLISKFIATSDIRFANFHTIVRLSRDDEFAINRWCNVGDRDRPPTAEPSDADVYDLLGTPHFQQSLLKNLKHYEALKPRHIVHLLDAASTAAQAAGLLPQPIPRILPLRIVKKGGQPGI